MILRVEVLARVNPNISQSKLMLEHWGIQIQEAASFLYKFYFFENLFVYIFSREISKNFYIQSINHFYFKKLFFFIIKQIK